MKPLLMIVVTAMTAAAGEFCNISDGDSAVPDFKTGYAAFGGLYTDMDNLNSGLQSSGYPSMDNAVFNFSFGENSHYEQFILGGMFTANIWRIAENSEKRVFQGAFDFSAIAGYDMIEKEKISLYPFGGIGFGWIIHHMALKDESYNDIATGGSVQDETLWQMSLNFKTGMGFDFRPKAGETSPVFGLRCGYNFDVSNGSRWYRGFTTVSHAPSFKMSGPFAEVVFGVAKSSKSEEE